VHITPYYDPTNPQSLWKGIGILGSSLEKYLKGTRVSFEYNGNVSVFLEFILNKSR
jgi:hypothetical protein